MCCAKLIDCKMEEELEKTESMPSPSVVAPVEFGVPWPEYNEGLDYKDIFKPPSSSSSCVTLLDFYSANYKSSAPREGWLQRIQNGQISVDGMVVKNADTTLSPGSTLVYHRVPWKEPVAPYKIIILYEDEHLLVINKPAGLQVLPGGLFQQRTVLAQLQWKYTQSTNANMFTDKIKHCSIACPAPVHRLGRGTSGILLCAKTKGAKSKLSLDFADGTLSMKNVRSTANNVTKKRQISKIYRALVQGIVDHNTIVINQPIGKIQYPGVASGLYVATPTGKQAESQLVVLYRDKKRNCTLVEVEIYSGRAHQIRIHMAYIGHPLVGDPLYVSGGKPLISPSSSVSESEHSTIVSFAEDGGYERSPYSMPGDCGYHLHAYQVILQHPISNKGMKIVAPPPTTLSMGYNE